MVCAHCGTQNPPHAKFCMHCSSPTTPSPPTPVRTLPNVYYPPFRPSPLSRELGDAFGTVAMVLGILAAVFSLACVCASWFTMGMAVAVSVMGIVFGSLGISQSKKGGTGNAKAVVGLILSVLPLVMLVFMMILFVILFIIAVAVPMESEIAAFPYYYSS